MSAHIPALVPSADGILAPSVAVLAFVFNCIISFAPVCARYVFPFGAVTAPKHPWIAVLLKPYVLILCAFVVGSNVINALSPFGTV